LDFSGGDPIAFVNGANKAFHPDFPHRNIKKATHSGSLFLCLAEREGLLRPLAFALRAVAKCATFSFAMLSRRTEGLIRRFTPHPAGVFAALQRPD